MAKMVSAPKTEIVQPALAPSKEAIPEVVAIFNEIVSAAVPGHFTPTDVPMLERYCFALHRAQRAQRQIEEMGEILLVSGNQSTINPWCKVLANVEKTLLSMAAKLRLTPSTRIDRKTLGRRTNNAPNPIVSKPWE